MLTVGEMVGDKTPQVPDRIAPVALLSRALSGAFVGAAVFKHHRDKLWKGALIGGVSSVASTFLFFYLRKKVGHKTHIHDKLLGIAEDAIAIGSGVAVMENDERSDV